ncbi:acidic leucine-rich nuclear phosphoprotein 32 family member E-like [Papaver somniferum]|uniref:acidic leucine-rich nuclear phosphoprotein 32 family member E-like n=1 Tax=Papaver somniferum TaxID=3469 RepID=UPI000E6F5BCB|nr:acidic leucine-rich nuclear phosphoprotein 32 family member E-like [Papaver somniferum]
MQPGWVKAFSDEEQQVSDEYKKNRQENNTNTLKEKLHITLMQRDEVYEELSDLQVKHEKLVTFIEEKSLKIHAVDLKNFPNDKDLVDSCVDTLQEIISFTKALKLEDEREPGEEDEEGDKGEKGGKGGDVDDSDDDDEEEGGKGGDVQDEDDDKEGSKGGDEKDGTESEKNEVPSETLENPSTPLPKKNEEEDGKDGTSRRVESETANKPRFSLLEHISLFSRENVYTAVIED